MLSLALIASLTVSSVLPAFDDFCRKAEVEFDYPFTETVVSKQLVDEQHSRVQVRIKDELRLCWYRGKVDEFDDLRQDIHRRLTRLDPADMMRWSQQACSLDEAGALETARRLFQRFGYAPGAFETPKVDHYRWAPSPVDPAHFFWLPVFDVRWYRKGTPIDRAVPQYIEFTISGTATSLVYFLDATLPDVSPQNSVARGATIARPDSQPEPPLTLQEGINVCVPFLRAIGAPFGRSVGERAKLYLPETSCFPRPTVEVGDRYRFEISDNGVLQFWDLNERPLLLLKDCFPERLQTLAKQQCLLDATSALDIAVGILRKLGYRENAFLLPRVNRRENGAGYLDAPPAPLRLPDSYIIEWTEQRPWWAHFRDPKLLTMEISGSSSNLIFFSQR